MNSHQLSRAIEQGDVSTRRVHVLEDDKASLESRLSKVEAELAAAEVARDAFRRDKSIVSSLLKLISFDECSSPFHSYSGFPSRECLFDEKLKRIFITLKPCFDN